MPTSVIQLESIIRPEYVRLSSLSQVEAHVARRQGLFLNRLAFFLRDFSRDGFELLGVGESGITEKRRRDNGEGRDVGLFTARDLCMPAVFALQDGLMDIATENLSVQVVQLQTNFSAENWGNSSYTLTDGPHALLEVTDTSTAEILYIDPTYGQIDHHYVGRMLFLRPDEVDKFYRTRQGSVQANMLKGIVGTGLEGEPELWKIVFHHMGGAGSYQRLVHTISGK